MELLSSHRFTYSMSFATLLATAAAEFNLWPGVNGSIGIQGSILYLLIPLTLVCANAFKIEVRLDCSHWELECLGRTNANDL